MYYKDTLLEIGEDRIILNDYYYPSMKPKIVLLKTILKVEMKKPTAATGKYRFHGTGNVRTWFPRDLQRHQRDTIFFMTLKTQWIRIGFTSEHSEPVERYFREKGLL